MASSAARSTSAGSTVLDAAIAKVRERDPGTAQTLEKEVRALRRNRRFGLVFERHLPELVTLPDHPVLPGCRVTLREHTPDSAGELPTWRIQSVEGPIGERRVTALGAEGKMTLPAEELVVVREFDEPIFPGLRSVGRIAQGPAEAPWHVVISGENHHALQMLQMTHRGAVDLIYIDPPYNTGNKGWIYSDRYVQDADPYKHSKWLSFMEKRLWQARGLLKDTGVIMVAIGDDEHHRLRMLMDQIFGKENFISDIVWQGGRKNDARYVSNGADYMLVYARDEESMAKVNVRWRTEKLGLRMAQEKARELLRTHGGDSENATKAYRAWVRGFSREEMPPSVARYNKIEAGTGRLHRTDLDLSWPGGGGPRYDVLHPRTGKPCRVPSRGWIYSTPERFQEEVEAGRVVFGEDETKVPSRRSYLDELEDDVATSVFESPRSRGPKHLESRTGIFRDKRFPNPKDHEVIMRWIRLAAPEDAVILDFFGGSGSTTEAVLRLNAEDGGSRRSILITNNELADKDARQLSTTGLRPGDPEWEAKGVFRHVTLPRISTVVTGERIDGSRYSEGLSANVEFFELTYLQDARVRRHREFSEVDPVLWLSAGARGRRIEDPGERQWEITAHYAVLADVDAAEGFVGELNRRARHQEPLPAQVFIVTGSSAEYAGVTSRLPAELRGRAHRLYDSYLRHFENLAGADR